MVVAKCDLCNESLAADTIPEAFAWREAHRQVCPNDGEAMTNGD